MINLNLSLSSSVNSATDKIAKKMMGDQFISCVPTTIRVEQMRVIRNLIEVKIPIEHLNEANFKDGLRIQVRSEKPFAVNAFWIVKIHDIHLEIEKDWKTIRDELRQNQFLRDGQKSLYQNELQIYNQTHELVQCDIKPPTEIDTSNMTTTPRDFYPLVIIVTCHEEEPNPLATDAAANIQIVHIKDSIVPIKSHVIKQYIKQMDGRILDVSQLYVEESAACFICFEEADPGENLNLFCLLPCRHSPICSNCIQRIRECPKCRAPIASVFDISAPSADKSLSPTGGARQTIDPSLRHLYNDADTTDGSGSRTNNNNGRQQKGFIASIKSLFGM